MKTLALSRIYLEEDRRKQQVPCRLVNPRLALVDPHGLSE
jgi:hypothetical protein